jgi:hypothetical protein
MLSPFLLIRLIPFKKFKVDFTKKKKFCKAKKSNKKKYGGYCFFFVFHLQWGDDRN